MQPEILLDISRLVSRLRHSTPTGVDRVEMAYAVEMMALIPDRLSFCAVHPSGRYGRLPGDAVADFIVRTRTRWEKGEDDPSAAARARTLTQDLWRLRPRRVPPGKGRRVLIHSSPNDLHREDKFRSILRREKAQLLCLLHDLIPIQFPEYARPGGTRTHLRRVRTVARLASAVITNSAATRNAFLPYLTAEARDIPVTVTHLGTDESDARPPNGERQSGGGRPYFLCVGTIEPRKNHLLLLNIWRRMAENLGSESVPRLVLVGRRGWENEQIIDMLERCPALSNCVKELSRLPDARMREVMLGARALLMPSFAEGYGMPVAEAIRAGVPVICSDLPAHREAGGAVPEFLDPLDGPAWTDAVMDYARPDSERREAQLRRMESWRPVSWREHVMAVLDQAEAIA